MSQYNTLNVELSNWQLDKWNSGMKNQTEVTLNLSSNVISDSNDATNSHELLLIDTQVSRLSKTSANGSKLSKTQLSKNGQSEGIIASLLKGLAKCLFVVVLKEAKRLVH